VSKVARVLFVLLFFPAGGRAYTSGTQVDLPQGVTALLPQDPEFLASAKADLNGDHLDDFVVILQRPDPQAPSKTPDVSQKGDERRLRELVVVTAEGKGYSIAARTLRAVLPSDGGLEGEDPFLDLKAATKSFTILHKFDRDSDGTWGLASKFAYSRRDKQWQLVYFAGTEGETFKPDDFGLINLKDFDLKMYLTRRKVEASPERTAPRVSYDDILLCVEGTLVAVRPDGSNPRYVAGDRFFHKMLFPCWSSDRQRIAYLHKNDIHVMDADGKNDRVVVPNAYGSFQLNYNVGENTTDMQWSPDGKKFCLVGHPSNEGDHPNSLYLAEAGSKGGKKLKEGVEGKSYYLSACWSPDSKKIAYFNKANLYVMDVATGVEKGIFQRPEEEAGYWAGVAWSRDGKRLLTALSSGFTILNPSGKGVRTLDHGHALGAGRLAWSKDAKSFVYAAGGNLLFKTPIEGKEDPVILYEADGLIESISW